MRNQMFIFIILVLFIGCTQSSKQPTIQQVTFKTIDTLTLSGGENLVFSSDIYIVNENNTSLTFYDKITSTLVFYNFKNPTNSTIIDFRESFKMYPTLPNSIYGVVELGKDTFLVCSGQFFLIIDKDANVLRSINLIFEEDSVKYYINGNIEHIQVSPDKQKFYVAVNPAIPPTDEKVFQTGKIVEVNVMSGDYRILPITLPADYKNGFNYGLLTIPHFVPVDKNIIALFPGSNTLQIFNTSTNNLQFIDVPTRHTEIKPKYIKEMPDIRYSYLESSIFYRMVSDGNMLVMFYWEGKTRQDIKPRRGSRDHSCFVLGFDIKNKSIVFDQPFNAEGILKNPIQYHNGMLYFTTEDAEITDEIEAKIVRYEIAK